MNPRTTATAPTAVKKSDINFVLVPHRSAYALLNALLGGLAGLCIRFQHFTNRFQLRAFGFGKYRLNYLRDFLEPNTPLQEGCDCHLVSGIECNCFRTAGPQIGRASCRERV